MWSFEAIFSRKHPSKDRGGARLATCLTRRASGRAVKYFDEDHKYSSVVHRVTCDVAWHQRHLKLRVAPMPWLPCALCDGADWVATTFTPTLLLPTPEAIFRVSGVSVFTVALDATHTFDLGLVTV